MRLRTPKLCLFLALFLGISLLHRAGGWEGTVRVLRQSVLQHRSIPGDGLRSSLGLAASHLHFQTQICCVAQARAGNSGAKKPRIEGAFTEAFFRHLEVEVAFRH